ncbi:MAG: thioesterase family protein [Spirochaetaceae bacterium]|jgi:predicted thioesterase|nr:thioesterase family protein [Spirochaetaceae bacterium]
MELQQGVRAEVEELVTEERTARALGSGGLPVYSTPSMIALMEKASLNAVAEYLPAENSTVGTALNVKHNAASPLGALIKAAGTLKEIDGRRLVFEVRAWDKNGIIGEGTHERFIIDDKKFMAKTNLKAV